MSSTETAVQPVRQHLERILESSGFVRNERLSRFLRFVVERHLEGKDRELKETVIAIEVFGRRPDFDPKQDPVVRTEAARLRARLGEYYLNGGKADTLVIELPKGGYVPRFREVQVESQITDSSPTPLRKRAWLLGGLLSFIVAAALGWWWTARGSAPISIAVLPLENTSHDPANDYFADGLTDELIRNLSIIDGLEVRSRTSSFALQGRPHTIQEAGTQLRADYILEGSVLREGEHLRIDAQLVRVRDDHLLWSDKFDRGLTDVFAIQDEIAVAIVNNLRLKLGRGRRRYETSVEAYDLYLRGRATPRQEARRQAPIRIYLQAIAKDPGFAPAYAALAARYAADSSQGFREQDKTEELKQMREAAQKAVQLDPLLGEAYKALGMVYARDAQWAQSEKNFRRAIELDPSDSETYEVFANELLLPLGRTDDALTEIRRGEKMDPLSPYIQIAMGSVLLTEGKYEEGIGHCDRVPEDWPGNGKIDCLGRIRLAQGRIDEAIGILARAPQSGSPLVNPRLLGYAYGRAGRREEAEKIAADVSPNAASQALIYAGLGDKDRTLEALERVIPLGALRIGRALNSPEFAFLRDDPRTKALRKRVGLPQ